MIQGEPLGAAFEPGVGFPLFLPPLDYQFYKTLDYKSQFTPYIFNQQYVMYSIGIPRFSLEFHLALILIFNSSTIMLCIWVGKTLYVIFAYIL